ncbi:uncharacterized protein B0H18DRAFT_950623 [Fomitopsis serialis]|uniref:uncharacterized protein n=1 Tax=Fomitopsis serialis TaxID=139415 RepID=UPI002007B487|nr:uncharacterized protein B0H18DRAFT_950623 [Neoantrodia serialis]KAH9936276.1 hypothetical protein B0H18DRAFT_950623 [Neoantrodia serialis]
MDLVAEGEPSSLTSLSLDMGGNAFKQIVPNATFPRMSPTTYKSLKATLLPRIQGLYELVAVPPETPEKADHGCSQCCPQPAAGGQGTSNFAVLADALKLDVGEDQMGLSSDGLQNTYFQVDVNVCADREDWQRTVFLHSYGDTGQAGSGFTTQREVFEWVATSRLFDARSVAPSEQTHARGKKRREPRSMYQSFLEYARERADDPAYAPPRETITQDDVLRFFGKDAEHAALLRASRIKQNAKEVFSGRVIEGWIGMRGLPVKWVMDVARERLNETHDGGQLVALDREPGHEAEAALLSITHWEVALFEMSLEEVQKFVMDIKAEMEESGTFELNWQREDARKAEKRNVKPEQ